MVKRGELTVIKRGEVVDWRGVSRFCVNFFVAWWRWRGAARLGVVLGWGFVKFQGASGWGGTNRELRHEGILSSVYEVVRCAVLVVFIRFFFLPVSLLFRCMLKLLQRPVRRVSPPSTSTQEL